MIKILFFQASFTLFIRFFFHVATRTIKNFTLRIYIYIYKGIPLNARLRHILTKKNVYFIRCFRFYREDVLFEIRTPVLRIFPSLFHSLTHTHARTHSERRVIKESNGGENKILVRQPSKWTVVNGQFRFESGEGGKNNLEKTKRREENNYKSQ